MSQPRIHFYVPHLQPYEDEVTRTYCGREDFYGATTDRLIATCARCRGMLALEEACRCEHVDCKACQRRRARVGEGTETR